MSGRAVSGGEPRGGVGGVVRETRSAGTQTGGGSAAGEGGRAATNAPEKPRGESPDDRNEETAGEDQTHARAGV